MYGVQNYEEEFILLLINSINYVQVSKIFISLPTELPNETKLQISRSFHEKILSFTTNNITSNGVSRLNLFYFLKQTINF